MIWTVFDSFTDLFFLWWCLVVIYQSTLSMFDLRGTVAYKKALAHVVYWYRTVLLLTVVQTAILLYTT